MTNGYLFREYIGAQSTGVQFSDVPINAFLSFHFILAFAIDYTPVSQKPTPTPTNGVFSPFWDTSALTPAAVAAIKQAHPNVAVMAAVGGNSVQDIVNAFFAPTSVDSWVSNAVTSLEGIINEYGLDGIDVDYEHFDADADTFVECVGRLLTELKRRMPHITTSIAPFERDDVQSHYIPLWRKYSRVIDYVNFQFYGYGANTNASTYVEFYDKQANNYPGGKVLASLETNLDSTSGLLLPDNAISGAKLLQQQNKLPGFFIWSADSSKKSSYGFKYETLAQQIIANH